MNIHHRSPLSSLAKVASLIVLIMAGIAPRSAVGSPITDGLSVWLRADMGITTSGSNVTSWADQATADGSQDATQGTANKQPVFVTSSAALNNQPVIRFDGTQDHSQGDTLVLGNLSSLFTTGATLFVVATVTVNQSYNLYSTGNNDAYWNFGNKGYVGPFYSTTAFQYRYNQGGSFGDYPGAPLSGTHIMEFRTGSDYTAFTDGTSLGTLTTANSLEGGRSYTFNGGTSHILGGGQANEPVKYFGGDIAEIIIYNRVLTDAERNKVGLYLQTRYGIQAAYVPEPSTALLVGLGGLLLRRRSRKDI